MTVEELKVLITAQTAQLQSEVDKVQKKMSGLEKTAKSTSNGIQKAFSAIKLTAIIVGLTKLTKACTSAAGDLVEVQNVVDTAFGESADIVNNWSKNVIKQYGMSETAAKRTASTFMAMSNGMGIANKAGTTMSITLAGLSADLASFWNTSQDEAFTALKSVYTGETETLKKYGVVMTDVNLKNFAMAQGIKKQYSEMTQAEKVALRYKYVLQTTADAQGDFAKTNTSWANQIKILKTQMEQLKTIIGTGLIAVLRPVIIELNKMLSVVVEIGNALVRAFSKIFGGKDKTLKVNSQGFSQMASSAESAAGGIEDTSDAAKDLKKSLSVLNFDELNKLQAPDTSSSSNTDIGGIGDIVVDGDIIQEDGVLSKWDKLMEDIATRLKNWVNTHKIELKFDWSTIKQSLITLGENIVKWASELGPKAWNVVKTFLESIDFTFLLQNLINLFTYVGQHLKKFAESIVTLLETILLNVDWDTVLANVINGISWFLGGITDIITTGVKIINAVLRDMDFGSVLESASWSFSVWMANFDTACEIAQESAKAFYESGLKPIVEWVGEKLFSAFNLATGMGERFTKWLGEAGPTIVKLSGQIGEFVGALWSMVEPFADIAWDVFYDTFSGLFDLIMKFLDKIHSIDYSNPLGVQEIEADLSRLKDKAAPVLAILTAITTFKVGTGISTFFSTITKDASGFIDVLGNIEKYFSGDSKIITGLTSIGAKIAETFGAPTQQIISSMSTAYSATVNQIGNSSSIFTTVKGLVSGLGAGFKSLWSVIIANPLTSIIALLAILVASFVYLWNTNEEFKKSITDLWNNVLKPIFSELGSVFTTLWEESIKPLFEKLKDLWDEVLSPLCGQLADTLIPILENIVKVVAVIVTVIVTNVANTITTITGIIQGLISVIQGLIDFVVGVFTGDWERAWDGIKEILSGILDAMKSLVSGFVDGIVDTISNAFNSIKSLWGSKDTTANVKVKAQSIDTPSIPVAYNLEPANIPKLAKGGVLYKSTLVEAGEYSGARNNPEIVSPQSIMKETMETANLSVVNAIYSIGNQISKTVEEKDSDVYMDGDKVTRNITKRQKELSKYSSASLVTV